ncbi:MAG: RHS repeat-associated core domain-containing protein [Chlamydiales bacterium]
MKTVYLFLMLFINSFLHLLAESMSPALLPSTESDPDAFIHNCCNVINGDYCESTIDLMIAGPDALILQRHYNNKNYLTGKGIGGWRIFPQAFLVLGKDPKGKKCKIKGEKFEWIYVYTGERSGGVLTYSGWKKEGGDTKDPLKINPKSDCIGMVNTYAEEMNGQTNHLNNYINCKSDTCELILGDGTKRLYEKVQKLPTDLLGEELLPTMASKVEKPQYFRLISETLPSGNIIYFSYDENGHFSFIEMSNANGDNLHSWIHFDYQFFNKGCSVVLTTSDEKTLTYEFEKVHTNGKCHFSLRSVKGSHCFPISYAYNAQSGHYLLSKKILPEGRFLNIDYDKQGRLIALKSPDAQSGKPTLLYSFSYDDACTSVTNAANIKTLYRYDNRLQLVAVECYDQKGELYRIDQKYYGKTKKDLTLLTALTIADGQKQIHSYCSFKYDNNGNVLEEKLYGNLTGKKEISLQADSKGGLLDPDEEECHTKKFSYSHDGFNLLTSLGDCKGNQTAYLYEEGSNRISRKLIYEQEKIKKREFHYYNDDCVCIKIIEDDGDEEEIDEYLVEINEVHITEMHPKEHLPGVGLSEIIEEKTFDVKSKQEILIKKLVNAYSAQGHLLSCATYDANDHYAYTVNKTYNLLGQVTSETDPVGNTTSYSYDKVGNQILISIPSQQKSIQTKYDYRNNPVQVMETAGGIQDIQQYTYDLLDRKITSTDRYGQTTQYKYDSFGRLVQLIHSTVLDEYGRPIQPIFSYTYDIFGNVLTVTDPKGYITQKTYNLRGDPSKVHYPDGTFELFKYDTEGTLHRSFTRDRIITVYEYDYLGRIEYEEVSTSGERGAESFLKNRSYQYDAFHLLEEMDGNAVTLYKYDATGKVIDISKYEDGYKNTKSNSRKTEIIYDALGRESKKKIWFDIGPTDYAFECCEYDLLNNIIQKRIEDADGNIHLLKNFTYDSSGRCIEESSFQNGNKQSLITTYDPFGEPVSYIDASDNVTNVIIDYGKNTLTKTVINPMGMQTNIHFDALGRIREIVKKDSAGTLLSAKEILYDALGNKSAEIHFVIEEGKQVNIQKTRWIHGPMSRLEKLIEAEGSPEEKVTIYTYNSLGQLESKQLPGAESPLIYTYDEQGYISEIEYSQGQLFNTFSYNARRNIVSASTQDGVRVRRKYNIFDQVVQEYIEDGEGKYALEFQYDRKGRLKSVILPHHSSIIYTYDAVFGRKVTRFDSEGEELYSHTYNSYDLTGKLADETLIGYCGDRQICYDRQGRISSIKTDYHEETVPKEGYNQLGHILKIQREGEFPLENGEYTYNSLSQLTSERNDVSKIYQYDSLDNRVAENSEKLIYNNLNQLIAKSDTEYNFDPQGNLLRTALDGEETYFESNILSQLIGIRKPNGVYLKFSYDPFGRRLVKKSSQGTISRSFYIGNHELGTLNKNGEIQNVRIPGINGDSISLKSVAIEIEDQPYALLHDIAGNVCALLDPIEREVVESYTYSAFGQEKIYNFLEEEVNNSEVGNPWRYSEKPIDEETGLIYFGLRYYDPETGRWISQDPTGNVDGSNLYAYCNNNPLNNFDRFGLETESDSSEFEEYFYGEVEPHCYCEQHRTCKRGGDLDQTIGFRLPTVKHFYAFEKLFSAPFSSDIYEIEGPEKSDIGLGFINGVNNDFQNAKKSAEYLSRLAGGYCVHAVYNATHGARADLLECKLGLSYIATEPVRLLHRIWNNFFEKNSASARFLMVCHSQGAIHMRNALLDYPPELRERITVVAIAPAAYLYQEACAHVVHIRNESIIRDFVPYLDSKGAERVCETIVNVKSHPDASRFDHSFISHTYSDELYLRIGDFIRQ